MSAVVFWCAVICTFWYINNRCLGNNIDFVALDDDGKPWWKTASFYQIYPRSFKDSNNDGIGDLNGITETLEYFNKIQVDAVWLSPIFKSPMADFGYDISDFYDIQPEYGTLDDFDRMIAKAKSLNIKIVLDFVPNHSSDENDWFIKSANKDPDYADFYIWHPGYIDEHNTSKRLPPSNWLSIFRGSAWEWNEKRKEFYFHQFLKKQPDLNYRNPKVVEEMKNVMRFWMDRGVAGFRIDAVPSLFEVDKNQEGRYPDEPKSGGTDPDDWGYLRHIYTQDLPETIDMVYQWRKVLDDHQQEHGGDDRVMMTEAYSNLNIIKQYFGNATHGGSHIPFNFQMLTRLSNSSSARDYFSCIKDFMKIVPSTYVPNWVIGNHDNGRVATRLGTNRIDGINMILQTLPGISITYYGEEIGMTNQWLSWEDTVDPAACNSNPSIYERFSRDPERTPFHWNGGKNAGFSTADKTWLPVADNYKEVNVEKEEADARSYLKVYNSLKDLRKHKSFRDGDVLYDVLGKTVIGILRHFDGQEMFVMLFNIGSKTETVNVNTMHSSVPQNLLYHIVGTTSAHQVSESVASSSVVLLPFEAFVLRSGASIHKKAIPNYYYYNVD